MLGAVQNPGEGGPPQTLAYGSTRNTGLSRGDLAQFQGGTHHLTRMRRVDEFWFSHSIPLPRKSGRHPRAEWAGPLTPLPGGSRAACGALHTQRSAAPEHRERRSQDGFRGGQRRMRGRSGSLVSGGESGSWGD